ncbi:purine nucleoside permease [Trametes elegans]|nr:purine nucleoside permease [Trametes elegans]
MWALASSFFLLWLCPRIAFFSGPGTVSASSPSAARFWRQRDTRIAPKVFLIGMFGSEGDAWHGIPDFNVLERNISVPGFSPRFPDAHCTKNGDICQLVTDEGEINAASTIAALVHSPLFNLTQTYFFIAGIAGISPKMGTLGSATFARYAVQVALQFEIDGREKPADFSTGYIPQGSTSPSQYPQTIYGTEVYEVNNDLRALAIAFAQTAVLADDTPSQQYRRQYSSRPEFAHGAAPPAVIPCDTATADVFWSGELLSTAFEHAVALFTNRTAAYCTSQQEDSATLGALLRGALARRVDFARVLVMRTVSDFDRPADGQTAAANLFAGTPGFEVAIKNIAAAGVPVVNAIVAQWETRFRAGVPASNYIGDIWGSLGGTPDFGPGSIFGGKPALAHRGQARPTRDV